MDSLLPKSKVCSKCGEGKLLDEFYEQKKGKYGRRGDCKLCKKQYREANKEKIAEQKKQYYEDNKEKLNERTKQYHQENKEKIAEQKRQYHEANKEKRKQTNNYEYAY